ATVDGQPAPILRADYIFRAVPVPAGEHAVELIFQPFSFTVGALISGLTLIGVAMLFLLARKAGIKNLRQIGAG
ncbi:MAG TPA: YfhO family protein, partial [Anaerolineae bacterium]|nr:YfhO family protein [Anaerolineae bacterium]